MSYNFFCYDAEGIFTLCKTAKEAQGLAELELERVRYDASNLDAKNSKELWHPKTSQICWGMIMGKAVETVAIDYELKTLSEQDE